MFKKSILNIPSIQLQSKPWMDGSWDAARLSVTANRNAVLFSSFLNHPQEREKVDSRGKPLSTLPVNVKVDPIMANLIFNNLLDSMENTGKHRTIYRNKGKQYIDGKPIGDRITLGAIAVGRDEEGWLYLSLKVPNRPVPRFLFKPNHRTEVIYEGCELSIAEQSNRYCKAWVTAICSFLNIVLVDHYEESSGWNQA